MTKLKFIRSASNGDSYVSKLHSDAVPLTSKLNRILMSFLFVCFVCAEETPSGTGRQKNTDKAHSAPRRDSFSSLTHEGAA